MVSIGLIFERENGVKIATKFKMKVSEETKFTILEKSKINLKRSKNGLKFHNTPLSS